MISNSSFPVSWPTGTSECVREASASVYWFVERINLQIYHIMEDVAVNGVFAQKLHFLMATMRDSGCGWPHSPTGDSLHHFRKWSGYSHYDRRIIRQQVATSFSEMEINTHNCGYPQQASCAPCAKRTLVGIPEMRPAELKNHMPIIHSYIIFGNEDE